MRGRKERYEGEKGLRKAGRREGGDKYMKERNEEWKHGWKERREK